jgi:hypothetical protein
MAARTWWTVSGRTLGSSLRTRETVEVETPAILATGMIDTPVLLSDPGRVVRVAGDDTLD